MEDVYFERIAGVGERAGASPRRPEGATPAQPVGPPVLNMALDDDMGASPLGAGQQAVPQDDIQCDENGFPLSPLRDQEDLWFVQASSLYRPIAKGARIARASGLILMLGGLFTVGMGALGADMITVVIGLIVGTLGWMDRGAGADLAVAKRSAPFRLALNQLLLGGLIIGCSWMTVKSVGAQAAKAMTASEAEIAELPAEMQGLARQFVEMGPNMMYMVFTVIVAATLLFQGGLALYYFTRRRKVRNFHEELPPWVSEIVTTITRR